MRIVFRADASVQIGTGHVMRCLTLANALRKDGAECVFVCRDLPGHLGAHVEAQGFVLRLLPSPDGTTAPVAPPTHAAWAGVSWEQDARETVGQMGVCDWLVVDHYAFDRRWQQALTQNYARLMVIDDLADRAHLADLLLDQNLGRDAADYDGLVSKTCIRLIGPQHALLRPEFGNAREASLARRGAEQPVGHILVFMGGTDLPDATSHVLDALLRADLPDDVRLSVVMGQSAPALERVRARAAQMPWATKVLVNVRNMARLMTEADLAIGAGGSTLWERCCLGLPSIIVEIADNQAGAVAAMEAVGAALGTGPLSDTAFGDRLVAAVGQAAQTLVDLSNCAAKIGDGEGARRAVAAMTLDRLSVRKAQMSDAEAVWHWRNEGSASDFYLDPTLTPLASHLAWFETALATPSRDLLIIEHDGKPAAHVRFDRDPAMQGDASVSICLNSDFRGQGLGSRVLTAACGWVLIRGVTRLHARIHSVNLPSIKVFSRSGFEMHATKGLFCEYILAKSPEGGRTANLIKVDIVQSDIWPAK